MPLAPPPGGQGQANPLQGSLVVDDDRRGKALMLDSVEHFHVMTRLTGGIFADLVAEDSFVTVALHKVEIAGFRGRLVFQSAHTLQRSAGAERPRTAKRHATGIAPDDIRASQDGPGNQRPL